VAGCISLLLTHNITDPHNFSSCRASAYSGIPRHLVSCRNIYCCQIHTVQVTGSNLYGSPYRSGVYEHQHESRVAQTFNNSLDHSP